MTLFTPAEYQRAFECECQRQYRVVDTFESVAGYALARYKLEDMARVLACPIKPNPPNWQHGRIIYSALRRYLERSDITHPGTFLDIGTAKGFSALCIVHALTDAGKPGIIHSVDVLDPEIKARRNTVAECDGLKSLYEIIEPWAGLANQVKFHGCTSLEWLRRFPTQRINFAFVDGRHNFESVSAEAAVLSERQLPGDFLIFDDLQIAEVARAVAKAAHWYQIDRIDIAGGFLDGRAAREYGIATRI